MITSIMFRSKFRKYPLMVAMNYNLKDSDTFGYFFVYLHSAVLITILGNWIMNFFYFKKSAYLHVQQRQVQLDLQQEFLLVFRLPLGRL